jgi:ribosome-interacting GTPase 1
MDDLRREIRDALVDPNNKVAFNLLYKEAWYPEEAAMGNSSLPTVLDKLCMVANIHTRNLIDILRSEIYKRGLKIEELQNRVIELEKNISSGINIYSKDP